MPLYNYKCGMCSSRSSDIRTMADRNNHTTCDNCGGTVERDCGTESPSIRGKDYHHPLHSDSLAINPCQIEEHRKLFPDVKIDSEGRPIFENYRQHDTYLEKCNVDKKTQRIKPKGRRIDKPKQPSSEAYPKENQ